MAIKHLTPKTREEIALARASMSQKEKIEEFIENTGSAMEIYMPYDDQAKLYDYVINKKYKLKILSFDGFGDKEENEENYDKKVIPWIKKGWKLFWHEDNYSSQEVILIHKPIIKEDAMGGVSAPMATLNNTPGMGNVTPAGIGKIGSGDNFGAINKKPYEQSKVSTAKKKKRKKVKEKLEEENINPYDKIGTAMAKRAKVPMTFKKKKSKNNQNAMVQKKFEHAIIPFDQFKEMLNESYDENFPLIAYEISGATFTESAKWETTVEDLKKGGWRISDEQFEDLKNGKMVALYTQNLAGTPRKLVLQRADKK